MLVDMFINHANTQRKRDKQKKAEQQAQQNTKSNEIQTILVCLFVAVLDLASFVAFYAVVECWLGPDEKSSVSQKDDGEVQFQKVILSEPRWRIMLAKRTVIHQETPRTRRLNSFLRFSSGGHVKSGRETRHSSSS